MADLLGQCRAFLVGRTGSQTASLTQIAQRTGFGEIATLNAGRTDDARGAKRINFFIVHRHLSSTMMTAVVQVDPLSDDDQIRFAPVILFADDGPLETYLNYIHMGFDDIITLPDKQPVLVQRLTTQLITEQVYFDARLFRAGPAPDGSAVGDGYPAVRRSAQPFALCFSAAFQASACRRSSGPKSCAAGACARSLLQNPLAGTRRSAIAASAKRKTA